MSSDPINRPAHYTHGDIEPIDAIESWRLGFNLGNVVKYIARLDHKGDAVNDLRKAIWYANRELQIRTMEQFDKATRIDSDFPDAAEFMPAQPRELCLNENYEVGSGKPCSCSKCDEPARHAKIKVGGK